MARRRVISVLAGGAVLSLCLVAGPSVAEDSTVRLTAAGDYASTGNTSAVLNRVGDLAPDLHLALGDLSYGQTGQEQAWCSFVTQRVGAGFPFQLLAGNHESNGQNGNINDFSACLPNQLPGVIGTYGRQWYVDVPRQDPIIRFVMISPGLPFSDGVWSYNTGSPRYNWTAAAIDDARTAGIPWIIVGMHVVCLSIGQYGCDAGSDLMNMLVAKRVDLVLSGHEHLYQRTRQLALGPGCSVIVPGSYSPACVANDANKVDKGRGTVFVTVGTGGVELRPVNLNDPEIGYFAAWSGSNASPTYGLLDVSVSGGKLTASFARAAGGNFTDSFEIGSPSGNVPPVAVIGDPVCSGLACQFDGSGSSDPNGTIESYEWKFGDGSTGSGASVNHGYGAAGTYVVELTVTDDEGATDSVTRNVVVTNGQAVFAQDSFARSVSNGWGSANVGGAWSSTSSSANFAVAGGVGTIRMASAGSGPHIYLNTVSQSDVEMTASIAFDKPATGGGIDQSMVVRRVGGEGDYRGKVRILSNGGVRVGLSRANSSGSQTVIQPEVLVNGLTYQPGDQLRVKVQAVGSSPTTLRIKAWKVGGAEPAGWQLSATDSTTGLQTAGSIGFHSYLGSAATNAPIIASIDDVIGSAP